MLSTEQKDSCASAQLAATERKVAFTVSVAALALCASISLAQTPCRVLDPELAVSYDGTCTDGLAEGYGIAKGRAEYRGDFHAGRKHGRGLKIWPSGDRYAGDFVEDRREGTGTYVWGQSGPWAGERYTGEYVADQRHGNGTYLWPSGDTYVGRWQNDQPTGPYTQAMLLRARAEAERTAAISTAGIRVCRKITVGIAAASLIKGIVTQISDRRISVYIEDPGQILTTIAGAQVIKGQTISDWRALWTPCV